MRKPLTKKSIRRIRETGGSIAAAFAIAFASSACESDAERNLTTQCEKELTTEEVYERSINSVARIEAGKRLGSGFVVKGPDNRNTYLLSNSHVVGKEDVVQVKFKDGETYTGEVIGDMGGSANPQDIAVIKISQKTRRVAIPIRARKAKVGSEVIVIGTPRGLDYTLTKGVVSQLRENGDIVQIDAAINEGNSGGPAINRQGCVVGMATYKLGKSDSISFAIATTQLQNAIKSPVVPYNRWKTLSHGSYLRESLKGGAEDTDYKIKYFDQPTPEDNQFEFQALVKVEPKKNTSVIGERSLTALISCKSNFVLLKPKRSKDARPIYFGISPNDKEAEEDVQHYNLTIMRQATPKGAPSSDPLEIVQEMFRIDPGETDLSDEFLLEWALEKYHRQAAQLALNYYCNAELGKKFWRPLTEFKNI